MQVQAELLPAWREPVRVPERAVQAEQTARAERVEAAPAGLSGLARNNRSLSHLRLCSSTRCTSRGSNRTALLVKEHATAANRLEAARTLLAALLTVTCGRLRRAGRTGRYGTRRMSRCRSRRFRTRSRSGASSEDSTAMCARLGRAASRLTLRTVVSRVAGRA